MTVPESTQSKTIQYPPNTLARAKRAWWCSPFRLKLLIDVQLHSVSLRQIIYDAGMHQGYTQRPLSEMAAESELMWLIAVGLLRREVDGQGLTDSFRLTPLGRQLIQALEAEGFPDLPPRFQDHIYNSLNRWLRLPGWLQ